MKYNQLETIPVQVNKRFKYINRRYGEGWQWELGGEHHLLYPLVVLAHLDIDAGHIPLATADAPADEASQLPGASALADQGTSTVALAGILALLTAGADEARVEGEVIAEARLSQLPLAVGVPEHGHVHLLEGVLVGAVATEGVLAPSSDEAAVTGKVCQGVRQADRGDVGVPLEVQEAVQLDDGDVVVQVSRIELRVDGDGEDVELNVGVELAVVVDIPLAEADPELLWAVLLDAVGRRDDVRGVN